MFPLHWPPFASPWPAVPTRRAACHAERNRRYTIDELAESCHRSAASVSRALRHADRYPFIEKDRVPGSKRLTFRLDPESRYTGPIRAFFDVEHDRERQSGTVPVDVWNLLEDVTDRFEATEGFVELCLFGSYATGEYYAGSDIDLLLAHAETTKPAIDRVLDNVGDDRLQVIPVPVTEAHEDEELLDAIRERSPVGGVDLLIPLSGEVST